MDPIKMLRSRLKGQSQRALAEDLKVSVMYLNDVINGRRPPGPKMLKALGLEKHVTYRRSKEVGE